MEINNGTNESKKRYKKYWLPPIIVMIILLIIYAIKGIHPFGNNTIANADMGQSYMTFFHYLYDILKNGANVFFDYNLGMGSNMLGGEVADGFLNPVIWIIAIFPRDFIPYTFSYILIIKLMLIAFSASLLFNKVYKNTSIKITTLFSVLYAFSGYIFMNYTNIMWLDVVALFPIFILSIKYMFEKGKIYPYIIILTLMLLYSYNLAYMVLFFIIFAIPIYIKNCIEDKYERKKAVFNIIIGTIFATLLSAFAFIPAFIQVMSSYRFSGEIVNEISNQNILFKIIVFIFYSIPLLGFVKLINQLKNKEIDKKEKKLIITYIIALIFTAIIPIIFERVNLFWHTGSYQCFPFRYGFIPLLILYMSAVHYFNMYEKESVKNEKIFEQTKFINIVLVIIATILGIINAFSINISLPAFFLDVKNFIYVLIVTIMLIIVENTILKIEKNKLRENLIVIISLIQIFIYSFAYIGVDPQYRYSTEWSDDAIFTSYNIKEQIKKEKINQTQNLYRFKELTGKTTENCPLVYKMPSMSTFLHLVSSEQVLNCKQLGYSSRNTQINDYGGTIVSDAIYGIKYLYTKDQKDDRIYNLLNEDENGNKLYEYKNVLEIGTIFNNEEKCTDIPKGLDVIESQNYLYKNLLGKQNDILYKVEYSTKYQDVEVQEKDNEKYYKLLKDEGYITYDIKNVNNNEYYYLYIDSDTSFKQIQVNGKVIELPVVGDLKNTQYPIKMCNGLIELGAFEDQNLQIKLKLNTDIKINDICIAKLNIDEYNEMFEDVQSVDSIEVNGNKIQITVNTQTDTKLFIPINYDKGWSAKLNNQEIKINRIFNTFMEIDLTKGENKIEMEFMPYTFEISFKITLGTVFLLLIIYVLRKRFDVRNCKILVNIVWVIGIIIYIACIFKVYFISIFNTFFN